MAQRPDLSRTLIRLPQVQEIVPYSRSAIYAEISAGTFPRPVKIGARASAWVAAEVQAWIDARIADRDKAKGGAE